ncbi:MULTISPECIES: MMPL family transporter [Methylorubrum]|uniref:Hopanoid biosynthesis associated RND transporter like protein HpnN n=2 Tax=Methylorubrum extorquens TaxID=408 RepID=H1KLI0_METEX|nr:MULTISPECIES: MMPL family transporter [Methylorubrum]ACS41400.1 putative membrane protein with sterol sensing domain; putative exporter, RND family [Methylorubrum extorquens AM1]EHP91625.1 hopanoid biosynthesis associated RND transporter like protein HpnN [Methylorubrum extorquens DSM 13060]MCP1540417.1 hopanoid biosynthesis associated RND transporter like protein HpnN [Methylorubrum extorquens]MCP1587046.1 hopanoid biosynthesis associated RND transporter like protein HpnN [Methylorubrum ext
MIERLVAFSVRRRWLVLVAAALLTVAGVGAAAHLFRINTDVERLIEPSVSWRKDEIAFEKAFPQRTNLVAAVIDGETPEIAEEAAARFAEALKAHRSEIETVYRPDGGPFFDRNGLLLMSQEELEQTTQRLIEQQGLLGPLAADPSLRGVMRVLSLGVKGVKSGDAKLEDLAQPMEQIDGTLRKVLDGQRARMSWQTLLAGGRSETTDTRKFVMIQPVLDYNALEPGREATKLIRRLAAEQNIDAAHGLRIRLTGPVAVADDEFATLADDAFLNYSLTTAAIVLFLWLALRSGPLVISVLITTFAGLVVTAALGLIMVGELNPISVAFAALFVGLGIDFGIQFAVRYRADRYELGSVDAALRGAARGVGWSLTLAAVSLLAGFFAFLPTQFRGVSELGLIAGVGMIVAYLFSLTLLPALIAVFNPRGEKRAVETTWMAGVDHWIIEHRKWVLIFVGVITVAGIPLLLKLPFDSNPMHLRSPKVESIATYLDLIKDPATSPNSIDVLAPNVDAVPALSKRLEGLDAVAKVISIDTFVPRDQDQKLATIQETAQLLAPALNPARKPPPPTDAENVKALKETAAALKTIANGDSAGAKAADRLSGTLDTLAAAPAEKREAASVALTTDLKTLMSRLSGLLDPKKIALDNLPKPLKAEWVTSDGRARIEVHPKGDSNDDEVLRRFAKEVQTVDPHATGAPIATTESSYTILGAFVQAGLTALALIFILLSVALRKPWDVAMTLGPLVLATLWTLMALKVIGMPLNFANIIALPLMLAVGVAFHIYYVIAWRAGVVDMLASSLTRAIFFSALTTGTAFGSLMLSSHPGTASMGELLALSLFFTLIAAFFVVPAFLGPPPKQPDAERPEGKETGRPPGTVAREHATVK